MVSAAVLFFWFVIPEGNLLLVFELPQSSLNYIYFRCPIAISKPPLIPIDCSCPRPKP